MNFCFDGLCFFFFFYPLSKLVNLLILTKIKPCIVWQNHTHTPATVDASHNMTVSWTSPYSDNNTFFCFPTNYNVYEIWQYMVIFDRDYNLLENKTKCCCLNMVMLSIWSYMMTTVQAIHERSISICSKQFLAYSTTLKPTH